MVEKKIFVINCTIEIAMGAHAMQNVVSQGSPCVQIKHKIVAGYLCAHQMCRTLRAHNSFYDQFLACSFVRQRSLK